MASCMPLLVRPDHFVSALRGLQACAELGSAREASPSRAIPFPSHALLELLLTLIIIAPSTVFNVCAALFFYWWARVPKKQKEEKVKKE